MALQKLCLPKIAENIDGYYHVYSTTKNKYLQRGFHLLQKVYSEELLLLVISKDLMQDKYADLIFNKYLKSICTTWLSKLSKKTVASTFARIGPKLEEVTFNEHYHKCKLWKKVVRHLTNVKSITYEVFCDNGFLKRIAKYCPRLETLDVTFSEGVTDGGLKYFYTKKKGKVRCNRLKEIFVLCTRVKDECIKRLLENLPSLQKIQYSQLPIVFYKMHIDHLSSLEKVNRYNLAHLSLTSFLNEHVYDDLLKICVTLCPYLRYFSCDILKPEHLNLCSNLPVIKYLDLDCKGKGIDVSDFLNQEVGRLKFLTLRNCSVSLSVLAQHCPRLEELKIYEVSLYNENYFISVFSNLRTFIVTCSNFIDSGNRIAISHILGSSPVLEDLRFEFCSSLPSEIKMEILKCCEQCSLKSIEFFCSVVEVEFLKDVLRTCSTLKSLYLIICDIPFESEEILIRIGETMPNTDIIIT